MVSGTRQPHSLAIAAASAAVLAGCLLLLLSGAPLRMPVMNFAALLIGLTALMILRAAGGLLRRPALADAALLAITMAIPLTALFGPQPDGVARWLVIAGVTIQPALMLVPPLAIAFALRPSLLRLAAVACAALGLALQPDPAAAAMLALGTLAAVAGRPREVGPWVGPAAALAALAIALLRTPPLPAVQFVEHVLPNAIAAGPATALVAAAGIALLFLPLLGADGRSRQARLAFCGVWLAALLAALAGTYPTPVLGFGGSAIVGYILSVGLLHSGILGSRSPSAAAAAQVERGRPGDRLGDLAVR